MKKILAGLLLVCCFIGFLAYLNVSGSLDDIKEFNENSDFKFKLATPKEELKDIDGYSRMEGFGGAFFQSETEKTQVTVSGFPDSLDAYKVTRIITESPIYNLFGISVGTKMEDAKKKLLSYKYKKIDEDGASKNDFKYRKGKVNIVFTVQDSIITKIDVGLTTTNKKNVVF